MIAILKKGFSFKVKGYSNVIDTGNNKLNTRSCTT